MIALSGTYATAKVFTDNLEETAKNQIIELLNQPFLEGSKVRIMPDTHAGAGCVIGFTADMGDKVIPNIVGVDIGCGMNVTRLGDIELNMEDLDRIVHSKIPSGYKTHPSTVHHFHGINNLVCLRELNGDYNKFARAIGTLGGGNHFIEVNVDDEGDKYLVIHSGSRNLGKQAADYYQNIAIQNCKGIGNLLELRENIIKDLKQNGEKERIQSELKKLDKQFAQTNPSYPPELCFLSGNDREKYIHDMMICQQYASISRAVMAQIILRELFGHSDFETFETIHNYVSDQGMIRKGAISAKLGEKVIIPINMRDGSILATGKGNEDWNCSAPHGAGRLMGRNEAKRTLSMDEFTQTMEGVYSTTVKPETLDEAPMAYKPMAEIIQNTEATISVDKIIKPIYNFKAAE